MKTTDYTAYFQNISSALIPVKSFFEVDLFEFETFADNLRRAGPKPLVMILEGYSRTQMGELDKTVDKVTGAVVILDKLDPRNPRQLSRLAAAEAAILQIRARMLADHNHQYAMLDTLQPGLTIESVVLVANEWAGFRLEFAFEIEEDREPDEEMWREYNPYQL